MAIDILLGDLDAWFNEPGVVSARAKLLSKLATLELCGWLEERFDLMVVRVSTQCGVNSAATITGAIKQTYGFTYTDHLREMLIVVLGERGVQSAEAEMRTKHPNQLDAMVSALSTLKLARGHLAHNSSLAVVPQQVTINAPSWCINQQRVIAKQIDKFEACLIGVSTKVHAAI